MSGKVKVKQLKKVVGDVNIGGMFEEMMGIKDAEKDIIIPKFVFVRNTVRYICKVFHQFCKMIHNDFPEYADSLKEIQKFADDMKESIYLTGDKDETEDAYNALTKEEMNGLYRKLKENGYVKKLVLMCSRLKQYSGNFSDPNNLKENFVNQEPGLSFVIFDFSTLDLKLLWSNHKIKPTVKKYILSVLAKLYQHSHAIYKCITSPDVDVEQFTEVLIKAIGDLKKQPQLHRCNNAFRRIEQSVHLLRDKFDDYYRESIASENPDMLVMNFIVDVSNQGGANASLAREFRQIIKYMHEVSQKTGKSKDPNVQKIFKMLNNNFSMMERSTGIHKDEEEVAPTVTELAEEERAADSEEERSQRRIEKQRAKSKKRRGRRSAQTQDQAEEQVEDQTEGQTEEVNQDQTEEVNQGQTEEVNQDQTEVNQTEEDVEENTNKEDTNKKLRWNPNMAELLIKSVTFDGKQVYGKQIKDQADEDAEDDDQTNDE